MLQVKFAFRRIDGAIFRFAVGAGLVAGAVMLVGKPDLAGAHGFAGDRFFPATILTDDPFVADEMSLPTFSRPAHSAIYDATASGDAGKGHVLCPSHHRQKSRQSAR